MEKYSSVHSKMCRGFGALSFLVVWVVSTGWVTLAEAALPDHGAFLTLPAKSQAKMSVTFTTLAQTDSQLDTQGFDTKGLTEGNDESGLTREGMDENDMTREGMDESGLTTQGMDQQNMTTEGIDQSGLTSEGIENPAVGSEGPKVITIPQPN